MLTIEEPRTYEGPPERTAWPVARDMDVGSRFLIVRKGPLCLLRYDACEYEVAEYQGHRYPRLLWVCFGLTRRGAMRSLRRQRERYPHGH